MNNLNTPHSLFLLRLSGKRWRCLNTPVKSRKQAIAIGLHETGASKSESKTQNKKNLQHTEHKKAAKK